MGTRAWPSGSGSTSLYDGEESLDQAHQAYVMAKLVKTTFHIIQERSGHIYHRSQIVTAYKRNRNLRDFLVKAKVN